MSDFLEDLRVIRQRELAPLRAEAGLPEDEENWNADTIEDGSIMRYIEVLEAAVVGKASVLSLVASATLPFARRDTQEEAGGV